MNMCEQHRLHGFVSRSWESVLARTRTGSAHESTFETLFRPRPLRTKVLDAL